jgi:intracellular sulfur oxidation DsrE/DsrF family protein
VPNSFPVIRFSPQLLSVLRIVGAFLFLAWAVPVVSAEPWPEPKSPAIPAASGYVAIPGAAIPVRSDVVYKAVYDARLGADDPAQLLPAIDMAGSELNALAVEGVPLTQAKFAIVFHAAAINGILDDAHYQAKFGRANPNLAAIAQLKKAGVELYVCGQNLAYDHVDPKILTPDVRVASDALIVLMTLEGQGYALLSY